MVNHVLWLRVKKEDDFVCSKIFLKSLIYHLSLSIYFSFIYHISSECVCALLACACWEREWTWLPLWVCAGPRITCDRTFSSQHVTLWGRTRGVSLAAGTLTTESAQLPRFFSKEIVLFISRCWLIKEESLTIILQMRVELKTKILLLGYSTCNWQQSLPRRTGHSRTVHSI